MLLYSLLCCPPPLKSFMHIANRPLIAFFGLFSLQPTCARCSRSPKVCDTLLSFFYREFCSRGFYLYGHFLVAWIYIKKSKLFWQHTNNLYSEYNMIKKTPVLYDLRSAYKNTGCFPIHIVPKKHYGTPCKIIAILSRQCEMTTNI